MSAQDYTYSIENDTPNHKVDLDRLTVEINSSEIVTSLDYISTEGDNLVVWFTSALSVNDKEVLDLLIAVHSGECWLRIKNEIHVSCDPDEAINDTTYRVVRKFTFQGTLSTDTPSYVLFSVENVVGSGTIRLRDVTNNKTIAIKEVDASKIYKDKSPTNWPDNEATLAMQVKTNADGNSVSINELVIGW